MTVWEDKARFPYNRPDRPDRPDHPKRLKERDDHMEKLPGRSHKSFGNLFLNWETNFRFDTRNLENKTQRPFDKHCVLPLIFLNMNVN